MQCFLKTARTSRVAWGVKNKKGNVYKEKVNLLRDNTASINSFGGKNCKPLYVYKTHMNSTPTSIKDIKL